MMENVQSYLLGDMEDGPNLLKKVVVGNWKVNDRFGKNVLAKLKGSGLEFEFELWHILIFCYAEKHHENSPLSQIVTSCVIPP